jgi:PTH1 family peptidyl-tRNA hydrolase
MNTTQRQLIVGLGNPGREYEMTRHNMGCMVVQGLAKAHGASFKRVPKFEAQHAVAVIEGVEVDLLLPETYMNESGRSVARFLLFFKRAVEQVVVVVDDIALPFSVMRYRPQGSAGGHNGLKSIEAALCTQEYARLRVGIGRGVHNLADHVLGRFTEEEVQALPACIAESVRYLEQLILRRK